MCIYMKTTNTYLPVEVDADIGPHVLGTDGQDLKDRQKDKKVTKKE